MRLVSSNSPRIGFITVFRPHKPMKDWLSAASLGAARRPEKLLCFGRPTTARCRMGGTRSEGTASATRVRWDYFSLCWLRQGSALRSCETQPHAHTPRSFHVRNPQLFLKKTHKKKQQTCCFSVYTPGLLGGLLHPPGAGPFSLGALFFVPSPKPRGGRRNGARPAPPPLAMQAAAPPRPGDPLGLPKIAKIF